MSQSAILFAGFPEVSGIVASFRALRAGYAERARRDRVYRKTCAQLEAMTDSDLADIGITRFMIADIAEEEAARA